MHRACGWATGIFSGSVTHNILVPHHFASFRIGRLRYCKAPTYTQQGFTSHASLSLRQRRDLTCGSSLIDMDKDISDLIQKVHDHPAQAVFYATGGGMQVRAMLQNL